MQLSRILILAFAVFGSVTPLIDTVFLSAASAEPGVASGRLADGRAFRTDENGYQLMDQIAELEVSNLELRQQLATVEAELAQKRPLASNPMPASKDRLPSGSSDAVPNCNELVSSLYLRISRLEAQRGNSNPLPAAQVACDFQSPQNPLWERISTLEQRLAEVSRQSPGAAQVQCDYQSESNPLWKEVRSLQLELQQQDQQTTSLSSSARRARLDTNARLAPPVEKPSLAQGTSRAERTELTAMLRKVEQLVQGRKSAFDRLKQQQSSVTVSLSQLRTAAGVSLDTLRSRISSFGPQSSRAEIERGLTEIQALLEEDISVIERLLTK